MIDSFFQYILRAKSNLSNHLLICFVEGNYHFDESGIKPLIRHFLFSAHATPPCTALFHSNSLPSRYLYLLCKADQSPLCTILAKDRHLRSLSYRIHTELRYTRLHLAVIQLFPKSNQISFCLVCGRYNYLR